MDQDKKRELRQLKREIKRAGNKHRRRELKRGLVSDPEGARHQEAGFGRNESSGLNGIDRRTSTDHTSGHEANRSPDLWPDDVV